MFAKFATLSTFHDAISWLNEDALLKVDAMLLTLAVFHEPMF
jgi:hypothetical protein